MRRLAGPVLIGLGTFLVVAALLLRLYAYPRVAVAPIDQNSVTELEAAGAEVFDTTTLEPLTTDLAVESRTVGDVQASQDEGDNVRVWVNTTSIRSEDGVVRSRTTERTAFDATSAEAVDCCGAFYEAGQGDRKPVVREGLVFKFPFRTEKKDYAVWDNSLADTITATYAGETSVDGLAVYKFVAEAPRTQVGERAVPASVLGGTGGGTLTAESMYEATKTYFVEPETGGIVDQSVEQRSTLAVDGEDRITTTAATLRYTRETVEDNVEDLSGKADLLRLMGSTGPMVLGVLGLLLVVLGVVLGRRRQE